MSTLRPKPTGYIRRTRESYEKLGFEPYPWFDAETEPAFVTPSKPLAESRRGMVSTAGTYVQGQVAYYYKDDTGVRAIPKDTPMDKIRFSDIMENYLVEARQDPATVFPSEVLRSQSADGVIGELADNWPLVHGRDLLLEARDCGTHPAPHASHRQGECRPPAARAAESRLSPDGVSGRKAFLCDGSADIDPR